MIECSYVSQWSANCKNYSTLKFGKEGIEKNCFAYMLRYKHIDFRGQVNMIWNECLVAKMENKLGLSWAKLSTKLAS